MRMSKTTISVLALTVGAGVALAHQFLDDSGCGVDTPRDVAADPGTIQEQASLVYLVDSGNNRIRIFEGAPSPTTCYQSFGSAGSGDGKFMNPSGVTVDSMGRIYVADTGNDRIQKFTNATAAHFGGCCIECG